MPSTRAFSTKRAVWISLLAGLVHATGLVVVALHLGYAIGPSVYSVTGMGWRYGGLVLVAAVPVWLAIRHRIVAPVVAMILTSGYVLGTELTPPGPTFRDVAELERLPEPTGVTVVENGLFIVRYMLNASVWTTGFLFLGLIEYTVRSSWEWLPGVAVPLSWLSGPVSRRQAAIVAAGGGLLHAVVMTWFAVRLGVTVSGGFDWLLYAFGTVGMWVVAAVPLYLLLRHRLVTPATLLTGFVLYDVWAEFSASVEAPHALYFGGWFFYFGILLLTAGIEYGFRWSDVLHRESS